MTADEPTVRIEGAPGGITIVEAADYINNDAGQELADAARERFGSGPPVLLFDLAATRIINSIGVSILLELLEEVLDRGGAMAFCNASPTIARTFDIMGVTQYARIYPDRAAALEALTDRET